MKDRKRSIQKELKEPDEFVTFWGRVIEYAMEHRRSVYLACAGVLVLAAAAWAVAAVLESRERKASELLGQARVVLAPSDRAAAAASAPTEAERQEAVAALQRIVDRYGATDAGLQSRLLLGQVYFEQGDYASALEVYGDLAGRGGAPGEMKALAWEGMGYTHEEMGEPAEAIPWYEKVTRGDAEYLRPWAWLGLARCREASGQPEQALEAYWRFLADFPNHPQVQEVRASVVKIGGRLPMEPGAAPASGAGAATNAGAAQEKDGS